MSQVHVIVGEDDFLIAETAKKIVQDGVGLEIVDSINATNAEAQLKDLRAAEASLMTPPFLDPKKVTWWKNVGFLPGGGKKALAKEVKEALEAFAKRLASVTLPDNQHFILSGPHLLKTSVFAKSLAKSAEFATFDAVKPWQAARAVEPFVAERAAELGLTFAPGAAREFLGRVGADRRSLASELAKLRDYLGDGAKTVTAADVSAISSSGVGNDPVPWNVTNAIGARDLKTALREIRRFELEKGFSVFMSGVIEKFFRQLLDVAAGRTKNMAQFALEKNREFLRNWSVAELRAARARFVRLREQAVSGPQCVDTLVVTTLVRVMRRAKR